LNLKAAWDFEPQGKKKKKMAFENGYLLAGWIILAGMFTLWLISLALKNSSIVDIFWGLGFVMVNAVYFAISPSGAPNRKWLITLLVTIWGLRLFFHILWRNWGRTEDFRYQAWRLAAGSSWWWRSFLKVFLIQGLLMWIISIPLLSAQAGMQPRSLVWLDALGVSVWGVGFFFEAAGDWQLARFRADPANRGSVLDSGVWRFTRHPNYFGDAAQWWGYFLIAAAAGGWWTVFSPVLMTLLLLRVSGVALLEKTLTETKPQYRRYIKMTSPFFPLPPRQIDKESK
jgi:steroid 5-alpha reductase family enzyme